MKMLFLVLALTTMAHAEIKTQSVDYKDGDVACTGFLAYDDAVSSARPGVLVIPEWWGLNEYAKSRAVQLARLGYIAFAADMYGSGKVTADAKEAGALATPLRSDRTKLRARALAALDAMKTAGKSLNLDTSKLAAIGYCFGGTAAIELARGQNSSGLVGVVSFHGGLDMPDPAVSPIPAKFLICAGADDPMVPAKQRAEFEQQLKDAKANYQINLYSGAIHAFTNPDADKYGVPGVGYNEQADHRSWEAMKSFFKEIFK